MKLLMTAILMQFIASALAQSPRFVYPLADNKSYIREVVFSPDNKFILSRSDYSTDIWNIQSGKLVYSIETDYNSNIEFIENGHTVVYCHRNELVFLDLKTGIKEEVQLKITKKYSSQKLLHVSPDKKLIVVGSISDSTIFICPIDGKKTVRSCKGDISWFFLSTDEKHLFSYYNGAIHKSEVKSGQLIKSIPFTKSWSQLKINTEGMKMAAYFKDTIFGFDGKTDKTNRVTKTNKGDMQLLLFGNNNDEVIVFCKDSTKLLWNMVSGKLSKAEKYTLKNNSNTAFVESPYTKMKISFVYNDSLIRLWDGNSLSLIDSIYVGRYNQIYKNSIKISTDGNYIAWSASRKFTVYSVQKREKKQFSGYSSINLLDVVISPDNKFFLTNNDSLAILWDAYTAKPIASMGIGREGIDCEFSDDGSKLFIWDGRDFELRNIPDGKRLADIRNPRWDKIRSVVMSRDGKTIGLVSSSEINIWKGSGNKPAAIVSKPYWSIHRSSVFTTDGKYLFSAYGDSVLLYLTDSAKLIQRFKKSINDSPYIHIYISPDDKYFMTHNNGHTQASIWDISTGKKLYVLDIPNPQFTSMPGFIRAGDILYDVSTGKESAKGSDIRIKYPFFYPKPEKYSTGFIKEDVVSKKIFEIKDMETGRAYSMLVVSDKDYLVFDAYGHFDGTAEARSLLSIACGNRIIEAKEGLDLLWVPGLAEKIMSGQKIEAKKMEELKICK